MKLSDQQALFSAQSAALITMIHATPGYRVRDGDAYRDDRCAYGHPQSLHRSRLAKDLILDKWSETQQKWVYQKTTNSYRWIGDAWKIMHELNCWGGDFEPPNKPDGNHISSTRWGRK